MSETLPLAVWEGTFNIFGVPVKCAVLDNGQRVIEADSLNALLEAMASDDPANSRVCESELEAFARWRLGQ